MYPCLPVWILQTNWNVKVLLLFLDIHFWELNNVILLRLANKLIILENETSLPVLSLVDSDWNDLSLVCLIKIVLEFIITCLEAFKLQVMVLFAAWLSKFYSAEHVLKSLVILSHYQGGLVTLQFFRGIVIHRELEWLSLNDMVLCGLSPFVITDAVYIPGFFVGCNLIHCLNVLDIF